MKLPITPFIGSIFAYFIWLLQTSSSLVSGVCTGNQITLVDTNKTFVQCAPCPPCPPGQEYTIRCHTIAFVETVRACINCPRGKFSSKFDTKPCVDCRRCSNRQIKRICHPIRNAKCGDCLAGYYYDKHVFGCIECGKCCHDGKDRKYPGCSKVGMCIPRLPNGCPTTAAPSTSRKPKGWLAVSYLNKSKDGPSTLKVKMSPVTEQETTHAPSQSTNPLQDQAKGSTPTPKLASVLPRKDKNQTAGEDTNTIATVMSVLFGVVLLILIVVGSYFVYNKCKERRPILERYPSHYSTPILHEPPASSNDRTLKDFVDNQLDQCRKVANELYKKSGGSYDFDHIANRFSLPSDQRQAIKNVRNTPGENPAMELMEVLCTNMPDLTVKQFAHKVKQIKRNDVYKLLEPYFEIQENS